MRARLACVALASAWSGAAGQAAAAETWTEVKTANFTVVTNAGEGTAQKRAKALLTRACAGGEQDACSMASQLK